VSVSVVELEGDLVALKIATIGPNAVFKYVKCSPQSAFCLTIVSTRELEYVVSDAFSDARHVLRAAGVVGLAESHLNLNFGYNETHLQGRYIVPKPIGLSSENHVIYVSDVVEMNPECKWLQMGGLFNLSANELGPNRLGPNVSLATTIPGTDITMFGLDSLNGKRYHKFYSSAFSSFSTLHIDINRVSAQFDLANPDTRIINATTFYPIQDGSVVWTFLVCKGDDFECDRLLEPHARYDLSGLPTSEFRTQGGTYDMLLLHCRPNEVIRTRVITAHNGAIFVGREDIARAQGNLHRWQTKLLLQQAMLPFDDPNSILGFSAPYPLSELGHPNCAVMLLGRKTYDKVPPGGWHFGDPLTPAIFTMKPQPIELITQEYANMLTSLTKIYFSGELGHTYAPARMTKPMGRFESSLPHVVVSTLLMIALAIFGIIAHFRKEIPQFTFVNVARSMADSDVPHKVIEDEVAQNALAGKVLSVNTRPVKGASVPVFALQ
jgi:hypothetical protein